jgi:hypothetical protein
MNSSEVNPLPLLLFHGGLVDHHGGSGPREIFSILASFFKKNQEMNPAETYFQDLAISSRVSPVGATHERVVPCALA